MRPNDSGYLMAVLRHIPAAIRACLLINLTFFAGLRTTQAVAPTNDVCNGAEVIPGNAAFPYFTALTDITEATGTGDPPMASCAFGNPFSHSIWYTFTPKDTAFYTLSSCADAPALTTVPDTLMAIYTSSGGCGGTMTELPASASSLGCADDSCGPGFTQAAITTRLLADTTYYIVVWQYGNAAPPPGNSAVQLQVSKTSPPTNDTGEHATEVFLNLPVLGTTILANNEYELPPSSTCFTSMGEIGQRPPSSAAGRDVVYIFTAPEAGKYSVKVNNYINKDPYDLVIYVATDVPTGPPPVTVTTCLAAANRSFASSSEEILCLPLTNGQRIYIFVDEDIFSPQGSSFTLEVTRCIRETEPNGTWVTADALACGLEASIYPGNDVDFYSLGVPPAGSRVFAMIDGSAANIPAFQMRVMSVGPGSTNTLEYDFGNNDPLFGDSSPNIAGTPLTGAPAFLRINSGGQAEEPYRLFAVVQPPLASATLETEPNNTPDAANMAANNYFYGTLRTNLPPAAPSPSADVDVYAFSVEAVDGVSDLIFLSLDCDPLRNNTPINARLQLLDNSGNVLSAVDDNPANATSSTNTTSGMLATAPYSPGRALVYRTLVDGTYYARVSASPNANIQNGAGDYLLSISRNGFAGSCGCNTSPLLTNTTASSSSNGTTVTGWIVDPDFGQAFHLIVDWGDNSPTSVTNLPSWMNGFSLAHQYANGASNNYTVHITAWDSIGASASTNLAVGNVAAGPVLKCLLNSGSVRLQLHGTPVTSYRIETSATLTGWATFTTATTDANGVFETQDTASAPRRFYRAVTP